MPNQRADGLVMVRFWIPKELRDNVDAVAKASGTDRSKALTAFLRWYIGELDAKLPEPATRAPKEAGDA